MLETLLGRNKKPLVGMVGRSIRLLGISASRDSTLGVYEFQLLDSAARNLCRTPGFVPSVSYSPNAAAPGISMSTYPPTNTIDGVSGGDWTKTCYMSARPDGTAWLQYDFPQDITLDSWRIIFEGTWQPTGEGVRLMLLTADGWKQILHGDSLPTNWPYADWRTFSKLSVAP